MFDGSEAAPVANDDGDDELPPSLVAADVSERPNGADRRPLSGCEHFFAGDDNIDDPMGPCSVCNGICTPFNVSFQPATG